MSWIGTRKANRAGIKDILNSGAHVSIITGGIAEMYLINPKEEAIYLKSRQKTIKVAIQEGLHIIPSYTFGNTKLFDIVGGNYDDSSTTSNSFIAKLSRKLQMSIIFFYGRYFLPIPYQQPLHIVRGKTIITKQEDNPSDETVQKVLNKVIKEVQRLYDSKKPSWETRPLVIY